jgi:hypothetical protein
MGKVINLNRFRKEKARRERAKQVETNRAQHGLSKEERALESRRKELRDRHVDGHKLDLDNVKELDASARDPEDV